MKHQPTAQYDPLDLWVYKSQNNATVLDRLLSTILLLLSGIGGLLFTVGVYALTNVGCFMMHGVDACLFAGGGL